MQNDPTNHKISDLSPHNLIFYKIRVDRKYLMIFQTFFSPPKQNTRFKKRIYFPDINSTKLTSLNYIESKAILSSGQFGKSSQIFRALLFMTRHSHNLKHLKIGTVFSIQKFELDYLNQIINYTHRNGLQRLELSFGFSSNLNDDMMKVLSKTISHQNQLRAFKIELPSTMTFKKDGMIFFAESLKKLVKLESFGFFIRTNNELSYETVQTIAMGISDLKKLKNLDFFISKITETVRPISLIISKAISNLEELECLNLTIIYFSILDQFFEVFVEDLSHLKKLRELKLDFSTFISKKDKDLKDLAQNLPKLQNLNLFHLKFTIDFSAYVDLPSTFEYFCNSLGSLTKITDLNIEFPEFPETQNWILNSFRYMLADLTQLKRLRLYPFGVISDVEEPNLYQAISKLENLESFSNNSGGYQETIHIQNLKKTAQSFKNLSKLSQIELFIQTYREESNESIVQDFYEALILLPNLQDLKFNLFFISFERNPFEFLSKLQNLKFLQIDITDETITDVAMKSLNLSIRSLTMLEKFELNLWKCKYITDEGAICLIEKLDLMKSLYRLDLCFAFCFKIGVKFALGFRDFIKKTKNLRQINLTFNTRGLHDTLDEVLKWLQIYIKVFNNRNFYD